MAGNVDLDCADLTKMVLCRFTESSVCRLTQWGSSLSVGSSKFGYKYLEEVGDEQIKKNMNFSLTSNLFLLLTRIELVCNIFVGRSWR